MYIYDLSGCCGLRELSGISDLPGPADVIKEIANGYDDDTGDSILSQIDGAPFIIFTAVTKLEGHPRALTYGDDLMKYIQANSLGTVVETVPKRNPNSGNTIKAYIWAPDYPALFAYQD